MTTVIRWCKGCKAPTKFHRPLPPTGIWECPECRYGNRNYDLRRRTWAGDARKGA